MHPSSSTIRIWTIFTTAVLVLIGSWVAFGWMWTKVGTAQAAVKDTAHERDIMHEKLSYSQSLHTLLSDTTNERTQLSGFSTMSAVTIVGDIRAAAADAGTSVSIDSVSPGKMVAGGVKNVPTFEVIVSAHDSFAKLYRLLTLLETLPLPSTLSSVSLDQRGTTSATPWMLNAHIMVYTTASQTKS